MRSANMLLSAVAILGAVVFLGVRSAADDKAKDTKIRIGTYDNRAIAIAYAPSRFHTDLRAVNMAAHKKAKDAGDQAKVKELEAWAKQYERQLHFQGFGRVPVDDLLEPVKEQVATLAHDKQLAAITMYCDFTSKQVELVDVTDDLVKLYDPSEKTLQVIREWRKIKPVKLGELRDAPAKRVAQAAEFQKGMYSGTARGDKITLKFDDKGKFVVADKDSKLLVEGTYKVTKDDVEFKDEKGPIADKDAKPGNYKWKLDGKKLTFTKVEDESEGRSGGLTGTTWTLEK